MATAIKTFEYSVRDAAGDSVKGRLAAPDEDALIRQLRGMGYVPLAVHEVGKGINRDVKLPGMGERISLKDLTLMCRQLATMVGAGLPLLRTLTVLAEQTEKAPLRKALTQVARDIQGGLSLSAAMGLQPDVFPVLLVKLCEAGELGGFLDRSLVRVASTFETELDLRRKVKSALMYPLVVILICIVAAIGMLVFIVPVFEKMYTDLGGQLPLPTRILVYLSNRMYWMLPLLAVLVAIALFFWRQIKDQPDMRLRIDGLKLRAPVFGVLLTKVAVSRFARNLGTMLGSGVPVLSALDVVAAATGNAVLTKAVHEIADGVRIGTSVADGLDKQPLFPAMVSNMVRVGEDTGQMESMLDKVADFYDAEVAAMTDGLTALLEPLIIVLLASIVGTMVIALYMPMFSIFNEIG